MTKRSKSYEQAAALVDREKLYTPAEAVKLAKQTTTTKRFDATVEVAMRLRVDRQANLHIVIGKTSFTEDQLLDNYSAALDEVLRAKPSTAKGRYLKKVAMSTTMGPGIQVDPTKTRSVTDEGGDAE